MQGLIVIDGPDGVGKSTLAQALIARAGGGTYLHLGYRFKGRMDVYQPAALHLAAKRVARGLVVIDRLWVSEVLYAATYRGGSEWPQLGRLLDRQLLGLGALNILALPDKGHSARFEALKESRTEMYDNVDKVSAAYEQVSRNSTLGICDSGNYLTAAFYAPNMVMRKDYVHYTMRELDDAYLDSLLDKARALWNTRIWDGFPDAPFVTGGGGAQAKYLMVGDCLSAKRHRALRWPFFSMIGGSQFMSVTLQKLMVSEDTLAWCNINEADGALYAHVAMQRGLVPIVLGQCAHDTWRRVGFGHCRKIRHPQHANRFNRNDDSYAEELANAFKL